LQSLAFSYPALFASTAISFLAFAHLWFWREGSLMRKAFWSIAVWLPLLGPLFYATLYWIPPKKPDSETPQAGHQY